MIKKIHLKYDTPSKIILRKKRKDITKVYILLFKIWKRENIYLKKSWEFVWKLVIFKASFCFFIFTLSFTTSVVSLGFWVTGQHTSRKTKRWLLESFATKLCKVLEYMVLCYKIVFMITILCCKWNNQNIEIASL